MFTVSKRLVIGALIATTCASAAAQPAGQRLRVRFFNGTGATANDLHVAFAFARGGFQGGLRSQVSDEFGRADRFVGGNQVIWDAQAGQSIDNGDTDRVEFTLQRGTVFTATSAFWTQDGVNIGPARGTVVAMFNRRDLGNDQYVYDVDVLNTHTSAVAYSNLDLANDVPLEHYDSSAMLSMNSLGTSITTLVSTDGVFDSGVTRIATGVSESEIGYLSLAFAQDGVVVGGAVVPAPGAVGLLACGSLLAVRRRR